MTVQKVMAALFFVGNHLPDMVSYKHICYLRLKQTYGNELKEKSDGRVGEQ